jgi:hypothetical protein
MARAKQNPFSTKAGNYLLRSTRGAELIKFMMLIMAGRVGLDGIGMPALFQKNGNWAGSCYWAAQMVCGRGLATWPTKADDLFKITHAGEICTGFAALRYKVSCDPSKHARDLDAYKIW